MNEYLKMLKTAFDFTGRTARRDFWIPYFVNGFLTLFLYGMIFAGASLAKDGLFSIRGSGISFTTRGSAVATIICIPYIMVFFYVFVIQMGMTVRRFHDAGIPGWVYLLCLLGFCFCGIGLIVKIVLCCLDSKPDNQWGPNPKESGEAQQLSDAPVVFSGILYGLAIVFTVISMIVNFNLSKKQSTYTDTTIDVEIATESFETPVQNTDSYIIYLNDENTMEARIPSYPGFEVTDYEMGLYVSMDGNDMQLWNTCSYYETKEQVMEALMDDSPFDKDYLTLAEDDCVAAGETTVNGNPVYYNKCVDEMGDMEYHMFVELGMQYMLEIKLETSKEISDDEAFALADFERD